MWILSVSCLVLITRLLGCNNAQSGSICDEREFPCANGSCIPEYLFCNGKNDCPDKSDEILRNLSDSTDRTVYIPCRPRYSSSICWLPKSLENSLKELLCDEGEDCDDDVLCEDGTRCIEPNHFCDEERDCTDGSDEVAKTFSIHGTDEIACRRSNKICVLPNHLKSRRDELCIKNTTCDDDEFSCLDGAYCLPSEKFCDGEKDCYDGSDEVRWTISPKEETSVIPCRQYWYVCELPTYGSISVKDKICIKDITCERYEFACLDGSGCIPPWSFCDGIPDCGDASDEMEWKAAISGTMCNNGGNVCLLPNPQKEKSEILCRNPRCNEGEFRCQKQVQCINQTKFCDGIADCSDATDEIKRNSGSNSNATDTACRPHNDICMLPKNEDWMTEMICKKNLTCDDDEFPCQDGSMCFPATKFCDGTSDCRDGSDEVRRRGKAASNNAEIPCRQSTNICLLPKSLANKTDRLCLRNVSCTVDEFPCADGSSCLPKEVFCDGKNDCRDGSDELPRDWTSPIDTDNVACRRNHRICLLPKSQTELFQSQCKNATCLENEFLCMDGTGCLEVSQFCDRTNDCKDGSDEIRKNSQAVYSMPGEYCRQNIYICLLPNSMNTLKIGFCKKSINNCDENEFPCQDGSACLPARLFCDGKDDCYDGSDELAEKQFGEKATHQSHISCRRDSHICLLPRYLEAKLELFCKKDTICREGEFLCSDGTQCMVNDRYCDGQKQCLDGSDETRFDLPTILNDAQETCRRQVDICIPPRKNDDDLPSEDLCTKGPCNESEFLCADRTKCIPRFWFCDGEPDCRDGSDEMKLTDKRPAGEEVLCSGSSGLCLQPVISLCDGMEHCENGIDECLCHAGESKLFMDDKCFRCFADPYIVLPISKLCNGVIECPDLSDECLCNKQNKPKICYRVTWNEDNREGENLMPMYRCESSYNSSIVTLQAHEVCDGKNDCKDSIDEVNCDSNCKGRLAEVKPGMKCAYKCRYTVQDQFAKKCDGRPECFTDLYGEECYCEENPSFCKYLRGNSFRCESGDNIDLRKICDGQADCSEAEDELDCKHRFQCHGNVPLSIPNEKFCDQNEDCEDGSDEFECSYSCNDTGNVKMIDIIQRCDGIQNCASVSDECEEDCIISEFSDTESLIKDQGVRVLVWLISLTALLGNGIVIATSIWDVSTKEVTDRKEKIYKALILNLSIADLMVGIYTSAISIRNSAFSGRLCLEDRQWRSGNACSALGIVLLIGSEQSVFTMVLITIFRLLVTTRLFFQPKPKLFWMGLALCWVFSISLSTIPLIPALKEYFVVGLWYEQNKLFGAIYHHEVKNLTNWLLLIHNMPNTAFQKHGSWELLEELMQKLNPEFVILRQFGFYSAHGVCSPTFFPDKAKDVGWWYTLILVFINFFAFVFMLVSYIVVYKKATKQNVARPIDVHNRIASNMQKKLTRILVTDFVCWMPVCIMAFLQISGTLAISKDAYLPVGLIILPINSALNPFLYSNAPDKIWEKIFPIRSWITRKILHVRALLGKDTTDTKSGNTIQETITSDPVSVGTIPPSSLQTSLIKDVDKPLNGERFDKKSKESEFSESDADASREDFIDAETRL